MTNKGFDRDRYYFKNGALYANSDRNVTTVLINSVADLDSPVLKNMEPGTVAHLPGFKKCYELSPAHEWVEKVQTSSSSGGSSSGSSGITEDDDIIIDGMTADERAAMGD